MGTQETRTDTPKPLRLANYAELRDALHSTMKQHGWEASGHESMRAPIGTLVRHEYTRDGLEVSVCVCVAHNDRFSERSPAFCVHMLSSRAARIGGELRDMTGALQRKGYTPELPELVRDGAFTGQVCDMLESMLLFHAEATLLQRWQEVRDRSIAEHSARQEMEDEMKFEALHAMQAECERADGMPF
jgi:hypothetical protein